MNDFPTYDNMSGCTVKGYYACPICGERTSTECLKHSRRQQMAASMFGVISDVLGK